MKAKFMSLSVGGVPLAGLAGLLICLWHPQAGLQAQAPSQDMLYLVSPSPKLDRSMTLFLRQEAKDVANCRKRRSESDVARAVAGYNLIAQECTPEVFEETHLPSALAF